MNKKLILQLILFSIIILIISATYYYTNFSKKNIDEASIVESDKINNNDEDQLKKKSSIIKNIKYTSADNDGNKYEIISKLGEIDFNDQEIINMKSVKATISLKNSEIIIINSDFAKYNTKNYDTQFSENVLMTYEEHKIQSDNLDLFFEKHKAQAMNNLIYENSTSKLRADKMEIDLITKNSKIFMYNKKEKIKISGKI